MTRHQLPALLGAVHTLPKNSAQIALVVHGVAAYERAFKMLEDALAESDGPWILGSNPTLADINLMPYVARLDYLGLFELWIRDRSRVKAWWTSAREWPSSRNGLSDHISEARCLGDECAWS